MKSSPPRHRLLLGPRMLSLALALACIVESGADSPLVAQNPEQLRAVPDLQIGDIDGPVALTHVRSLLALDDRLYLTQALDKQIRVLSTEGDPLAVWGRHGDGPGEYQFPQWIGFVDGRITVVDWMQKRITYLDRQGNVLSTRPQPSHTSPTYWFHGPVFAGTGDRVVIFGTGGRRLPDQWEILPGLVFGPDDSVIDSVTYRYGKRRVYLGDERGSYSMSHPIEDGARWAISPNGTLLVVADHVGRDADLTLARYFIDTGHADTLSLPLPMIRVRKEHSDSVQRAIVESQAALADRFGARALREAARAPDRIPAANAILVTNEGEIWFREPNFTSGPDLWRVVTPSGKVRATVEVPKGLEIMAVSGQILWAHHQDEYFVSYITRLRLEER